MDILIGETDNYDGVTVTMNEPMDAEVFTHRLRASLSHWRQEVFFTTFFSQISNPLTMLSSLEFEIW